MSKPLSEQVAELEAKQHHLWDVKEAIRVENLELWSKNERLEAERDDLQRQVQEVRDEIATLRAGQGRWPGETIASEDVPFKGMTDLRYKEPEDDFPCCSDTTPRLTVHKLNVAPVGSAIYGRNLKKGPDERWWCGPYNYSAEDLIANGWDDATLVLPEQS